MERKIIHVVGTGTIGEPLIGLLCDYREKLGLDEITFHKNSPLKEDRSKILDLIERGARLACDKEKEKQSFLKKKKNGVRVCSLCVLKQNQPLKCQYPTLYQFDLFLAS